MHSKVFQKKNKYNNNNRNYSMYTNFNHNLFYIISIKRLLFTEKFNSILVFAQSDYHWYVNIYKLTLCY